MPENQGDISKTKTGNSLDDISVMKVFWKMMDFAFNSKYSLYLF